MKLQLFISLLLVGFLHLLSGCDDKIPEVDEPKPWAYDWTAHRPFEASYMADLLPVNTGYDPTPIAIGTLRLDESSGVCASIRNPGMLWTHEDAGNPNFIYLIDGTSAEVLCRYRVTGAANQDWEDIEIVQDPQSGQVYLYIADTGDNDERRQVVSVYQFEEPVYTPADQGKTLDIHAASLARYNLRYPDGPHDVESMFVDADTRDIYLVTKRDAVSKVYVMPYPYSDNSTNDTYFVGDLGFREASAASLNFRGNKLIIRNRQNLFYWERLPDEQIWDMLARTPQRLPYVGEVQGEAVCFDGDDNYYTTSERAGLPGYPPIYRYLRIQ